METRDVQTGFTLVELMFTVTLAAILLTFAVPALREAMINNQLNRATDELYEFFMEARALSIQKNKPIYVDFRNGSGSQGNCFGYQVSTPCQCNVAGSCQKVLNDDRYSNVQFFIWTGSTTRPTFSPTNWTNNRWRIDIRAIEGSVSGLQNIRITPTGQVLRLRGL